MPDRSAEEIRLEIAAERQRLVDDVAELRRETRIVIPVAAAGLVAVAVLSRSRGVKPRGKADLEAALTGRGCAGALTKTAIGR